MMTRLRAFRAIVTAVIRGVVLDLLFAVAYVLVVNLFLFTSVLPETVVSTFIGVGFVLLVPGYAFVAALFPEPSDQAISLTSRSDGQARGGIDWLERLALSFVTSIVVVTFLMVLLSGSQSGIQRESVVIGLSVFTLVATVVAAIRRVTLPSGHRYAFPAGSWIATTFRKVWSPRTRLDAAMHVVVAVALVGAVVSAGYAVSVPRSGESFTEFYVVTENENGELVADEYPTNVIAGEQQSLVVGLSNQEHRTQDYSVVVLLQRADRDGNQATVREKRVVATKQLSSVSHNDTEHRRITFTPEMTGEDLRLQFLLYRGPPPETLSVESAYHDLHIWLSVSPAENRTQSRITDTGAPSATATR